MGRRGSASTLTASSFTPQEVKRLPIWVADVALVMASALFVVAVTGMAMAWGIDSLAWYIGSWFVLLIAGFVRFRRPSHPLTGWLCLIPAFDSLGTLLDEVVAQALATDLDPWLIALANFAEQMIGAVGLLPGVIVLVLLPDGVVRSRLERRTIRATGWLPLLPCVLLVVSADVPIPSYQDVGRVVNPMHVGPVSVDLPLAQALGEAINVVYIVALVLVVVRYRRSDGDDRRRLRWLLLPMMFVAFSVVASAFSLSDVAFVIITIATSGSLALAVGLAILAPARIDVDKVLRTSALYGVLWVLIASAYAGASVMFGLAIGQRSSSAWAIGVTVVAMLILQPLRSGMERLTGRWLYGAPPDPRRAVIQLGDSLEHTYDLDTLLAQIETVLENGLGLRWARVRLAADAPPPDLEAVLTVPVTLDDQYLGVVECGPKTKGKIVDDDAALVTTLARQAALAIRNVGLTDELKRRTAELTASRARLVEAEEAERRRIERDIHDGAQQELVALIGQSGLLRRRLRRDLAVQDDDLALLQSGLQQVLTEIRQLSAGIHPSLLRNRGLLAAVEALAVRHPVPVRVQADASLVNLRLPAVIEGAGYFTIAESLANSAKYAHADVCEIEILRSNGTMSIRVDDDGRGFDPTRVTGHGLRNLSERLSAIGGTLDVTSAVNRGTSVVATMPTSTTGDSP